jgi:lysozyme
MTTSPNGRKLIEDFESLRLTAYQDSGGIWTVGYGHTKGVTPHQVVTAAQADFDLEDDLREAEEKVTAAVTAPLTQNQFDALVSFTFNVGHLANTTLLGCLNQEMYPQAADQFLRFDHAGGAELPGLLRRRAAERALFLEPMTEVAA